MGLGPWCGVCGEKWPTYGQAYDCCQAGLASTMTRITISVDTAPTGATAYIPTFQTDHISFGHMLDAKLSGGPRKRQRNNSHAKCRAHKTWNCTRPGC